jgi:ribonuclease E
MRPGAEELLMLDDNTPADTTDTDTSVAQPEDTTDTTDTSTAEAASADSISNAAAGTGPVRRRRAAGRPAGPPAATFSAAAAPSTPPPAVAARVPAAETPDAPEPLDDAGHEPGADEDADAASLDLTAEAARGARDGVAPEAAETPVVGPVVTAPVFQAADATVARPRRRAASRPAGSPTTPAHQPVPVAAGDTPVEPAEDASADTNAELPPEDSGPERTDDKPTSDTTSEQTTTAEASDVEVVGDASSDDAEDQGSADATEDTESSSEGAARRRRRRGGRRRRRSSGSQSSGEAGTESEDSTPSDPSDSEASETTDGGTQPSTADDDSTDQGDESGAGTSASSRRRRRRRRRGEETVPSEDDPANTTVRVRERKAAEDEITSVHGSTRLEAKKQRRREGRDAGRRRVPVISEAEFLARREAVDREMVVRRRGDLMQIAVLEDKILAEHYVARGSQTSLIGNIYLGRVQNVLPSMEAAFIDIGKGRNAVLYAGEVDWKAFSGEGKPRRIEEVLSSGQSVLVQVTKDPVGHKGARLTSQVSLAGRFLVYVPGGHTSGISRKLPDTERSRLKSLLKDIVPAEAGVIVRTAAEGATEEQLTHDVAALTARWDDVTRKATGQGPKLLYAEPDLMIKVIRDLYNEDFKGLTVQGEEAWTDVQSYVEQVAPDLGERLRHWEDERDVFAAYRIDEQIAKGTDRKVWLPSGGSLVIDRTEAMTVVDVNTGKFTGSGGNLEETVTKNNLEAAEEIVRQLRLRDIGGIIVIDFIDMVLEDNRDLVLRRLVECLGRDRTRHQVAEVTSLGLVQMTRKRIGTGLLEAFSETCTCCEGRGFHVLNEPVLPDPADEGEGSARGRESGRSRGRGSSRRGQPDQGSEATPPVRTPALDPRLRPKPHPPEPTPEPAEGAPSGGAAEATVPGVPDSSAHDEPVTSQSGSAAATEVGADVSAEPDATEVAPPEPQAADLGDDVTDAAPPEPPAKPKRARRSRAKTAVQKPAADDPVEPASTDSSAEG